MDQSPLFSKEIDKLIITLQEAARASKDGVRFIEPSHGVWEDTKSKRHHIIFGRRGSGKSSLLRKIEKETDADFKNIYINAELINENDYPDILIHVLILISSNLLTLCTFCDLHFFKYVPFHKARSITTKLILIRKQLEVLLHSQDDSQLETRSKQINKTKSGVSVGLDFSSLKMKLEESETIEKEVEEKEQFKRNKNQILHRNLLKLRSIFFDYAQYYNSDICILIDDLYHITKKDQAPFLGFLHKIAKDNRMWLKIGTIRFRSEWYRYGSKPVGVKIGDDVSEIDLDLTFERYSTTKLFLTHVIENLLRETDAPKLNELVTEQAIDRLIIACGGVARDFINIFRLAILKAKERLTQNPKHTRGVKITVEDINEASSEYGSTKLDEFKKDSKDSEMPLKKKFDTISKFCIEKSNHNIFLLPQDYADILVEELVDLRLIHRVSPRVTISKKQGKVYKAYMLDLSQYAGSRTIRNFKQIEFWKPENKEAIRKIGLIFPIYDPN